MSVNVLKEKIICWIAFHLPRYLIYWCAIRLLKQATLVYSDRSPYEIDILEAIDAWNKPTKH